MKASAVTKRRKRTSISKGIARICSHCIEWTLNGTGLNLSSMDMESITNALVENRLEGELSTITPNGEIVSGQWSIQWN